jgi:hypothetical protein
MDATEVINSFFSDLKDAFGIDVPKFDTDEVVKEIEENYYPSLMKILQRDDSFFDEPRILCDINISELWRTGESNREAIWKHMQMCMFSSFLHGDINEKIGTIVKTLKNMWNSSGNHDNDEITRLLNDENSEDHFKEILEYLQETRLAKIFHEIVEQLDVSELDLNFENPQQIVEMLRNPEHPNIKKVVTKVQNIIKHKMERGEFTQNMLVAEVEGIKAKIQGIFGNIFNEALGGRRGDTPAHVLMGNSPEARRQRMLARLQKKQRDKNSQ